ncbi:Arb2 domain-containing protein [Xylaria digitata]|nr:Arb2 domain-containing protein [Xylaria digitata]
MFRRKWSSLPEDPEFSNKLLDLGYYINEDDEIRSVDEPDCYFKYFLNRNPRINMRQRFAMNQAIQDEIHKRLKDLGLTKVYLPCRTNPVSEPHVPIFMTPDVARKARVVVIFGETDQDLGVLAHRVLGGPGGVDKGSMVSIIRALRRGPIPDRKPSVPGVILANMGELIWWPWGRRTLSRSAFDAAPMRSAAHTGNHLDPQLNRVPGNESPAAHVKYFFEHVVPDYVKTASLDIIGLGDGADFVTSYLNCDETWNRVGYRINCFASVGGQFPEWEIKCDGLRSFLKDRARAYVPSTEPLGLVLSGDSGNSHTTTFTSFGCPVFSAGEAQHVETLFISSYPVVLDWIQEVTNTHAMNKPYKNPVFTVVYSDVPDDSSDWVDCKDEVDGAEDDGAGNRPSQKEPTQEASLREAHNQNQDMQAQCQPQGGVTAAALSQIPDGTSGARKGGNCSSAATDGGSIRSDPANVEVKCIRDQPFTLHPYASRGSSGPYAFTPAVGKGENAMRGDEVLISCENVVKPISNKKMEGHERVDRDHEYVVVIRPKGAGKSPESNEH